MRQPEIEKRETFAEQDVFESSQVHNAWHNFASVMLLLAGSDVPSRIAAYLGHGVTAQNVRDWRRGHTGIPTSILEQTRQRLSLAQERLNRVPAGPGRRGLIQQRIAQKKNAAHESGAK